MLRKEAIGESTNMSKSYGMNTAESVDVEGGVVVDGRKERFFEGVEHGTGNAVSAAGQTPLANRRALASILSIS